MSEQTKSPCPLCAIDAQTPKEDERRMAYYLVGKVLREDDPSQPCWDHMRAAIFGAALLGEAMHGDFGGYAKQLRAIATLRLVDKEEQTDG